MLKPNELRIGNVIKHPNWEKMARMIWPRTGIITQISQNSFVVDHKYSGKNAEPIEVAGGWLERMGFKKDGNGFYMSDILTARIRIGYHNGHPSEFSLFQDGKEIPFAAGRVKYIHQLQNLYFALTGDDLNLKP